LAIPAGLALNQICVLASKPHAFSNGSNLNVILRTPDLFLRQSGWLMIANVVGGPSCGPCTLVEKISEGEYGNFGALLAVVMVLPTLPLQMVMAQQTARAIATGHIREVSGIIRSGALLLFLIWLVATAAVLLLQQEILTRWKMDSPLGIYLTLAIVLFALWVPLLLGALQGSQDFLWLGWTMVLNAVARFGFAAVAVIVFHAYAAGMVAGVLIGFILAFAVGAWRTRSIWLERSEPFDKAGLLRQVTPLMIGFLGFQILFTADTMFVKAYFGETDAGYYVSAGTLSRALLWLVLPLAAVMFPRLVHSAVKSQKSDLMSMVLVGTAVMGAVGAVMLWLLGPWVVKLVFKDSYVQVVTALLPWYAFAMVPLAVANVLLNNLLARPGANALPAACVLGLALLYMFALTRFHASLVTIPQVMGVFNLLLLGICGWFSWQARNIGTSNPNQDGGLLGPGSG
jgi:O-antigen/teichoic acid export membrane protein